MSRLRAEPSGAASAAATGSVKLVGGWIMSAGASASASSSSSGARVAGEADGRDSSATNWRAPISRARPIGAAGRSPAQLPATAQFAADNTRRPAARATLSRGEINFQFFARLCDGASRADGRRRNKGDRATAASVARRTGRLMYRVRRVALNLNSPNARPTNSRDVPILYDGSSTADYTHKWRAETDPLRRRRRRSRNSRRAARRDSPGERQMAERCRQTAAPR